MQKSYLSEPIPIFAREIHIYQQTNERAHARGLGVHCLAMSEEMDLDRTDPPPARAHKRTAEEAGLNELPRRIKVDRLFVTLSEAFVNPILATG